MAKERISGIYKITNLITNKCYIGASINIYSRWQLHTSDMKRGFLSSPLYNDSQKYGVDSFVFEIIEICGELEFEVKEKVYIDSYKSCDEQYGYNKRYFTKLCRRVGVK